MYPFKMKPVFKQPIWGGTGLKDKFDKEIPGSKTGESWEVACHENGKSTIVNGEFCGKTLEEMVKRYPNEILGTNGIGKDGQKFPLLFKLIDANNDLSVQVHPNDEFAGVNENGELGKTELWYVLHAEPGSRLVYGVANNVTREAFAAALNKGELEGLLNYVNVDKGDVFYIPAGTIHAIGKGCLIAEIQQNSDTTYRVYDYNRKDAQGNPRELHVEKALAVSEFKCMIGKERSQGEVRIEKGASITRYVKCDYFAFDKIKVSNEYCHKTDGASFQILFFASGNGTISGGGMCESFKKGESFLIPASIAQFTIAGSCEVLMSRIEK